MYLIKRRLEREYGMRGLLFSYPSVRGTFEENAAALAAFIHEHESEGAHIVGHSLGGIVGLRALALDPHALPGRVVCLGSPLSGSRAGSILSEFGWADDIIGSSLPDGAINQSANDWAAAVCATRDIGVIAGNVPIGLGRLVTEFDGENDGTVAVSETHLDGATDHLTMAVSHKGMLVSASVADQAAAFLKRGEFLR